MRLTRAFCMWIAAFSFSFQVHASVNDSTRTRRWYHPDYIPFQFAGNVGLISTGVGFTSGNEGYNLDLLYGYVPRSVAGTYIHTVTAKNYLSLGQYPLNAQRLVPYIGLGISIEVSSNAFFKVPSHFPDGYYDFPKNLHLLACGGIRIQHLFSDQGSWLRGIEFCAEGGTIDLYLWYKMMTRDIKLANVFSAALRVNFIL